MSRAKRQEKLYHIIDEYGMSIHCFNSSFIVNDKGKIRSDCPARTPDEKERLRLIKLAKVQEAFLAEELRNIIEVKKILESLPKVNKGGRKDG